MWFMHSGGPPQLKHQKSADMKYLADNFQDNCQGWNFSNCKGLDFSGCQGRFFFANWPRVVQSIKSYSSDKSKMPRSHKLYLALLNLMKLWWDNHLHQYKDTIYCIYTILSSCEYIHINYKIVIYYIYAYMQKKACKPQSYASSKLWPTHSLTGVKCRATSVARNPNTLQSFVHIWKQG